MKKLLLYTTAFAAIAFACNKLDNEPIQKAEDPDSGVKMITEKVIGGTVSRTKATIADADASFSWTAGDNIAVHISNGKYVYTSDAGASGASTAAATASFTVAYPDGYSRDAFAIYPCTIVDKDATNYGQSSSPLDVTLPSSYILSQVSGETSPCPMIATNTSGSGWTFKQLCGLLRLTVSDIPAGTKRLVLDFNGNKVCGSFSIASTVTPGTSTINTSTGSSDDKITITKDGTNVTLGETTLVLNIPLPTGDYSNLTIKAYDALSEGNLLRLGIVPFSYTATRTKGVKKSSSLSNFSFTFKNGSPLGDLRFVRIFSCQNKLYNGASTYGPFTASSNTDMDNPLCANLKFASNDGDLIAFQVIDADGKVYSGSYDAPVGGFENDKFYDLTVNVSPYTFTVRSGDKKVYFSPGDLGVDNGVYSFTEPFTSWDHGNTTTYDNDASKLPKKRVWFDIFYSSENAIISSGTVYGISDWRSPNRAGSSVATYEWNYLVDSRTMNAGVSRYYKVTIPGHQYCLLLPPDETQSTDIGTDLTSGEVTDYAKYLGKGFVLLFNTKGGQGNPATWNKDKQGFYWTIYNTSNRYYFTWPDSGPAVDWGSSRMKIHVRYVRNANF